MLALGKVKFFQAKGVRQMFKQCCALPWPINCLTNYAVRDNATGIMGKKFALPKVYLFYEKCK